MTYNNRPVIGITLELFLKHSEKYKYSQFPWYAIRKNYADSVVKAGGLPVFIPYQDFIDDILQIIDGLIFSGRDGDIHPKFYNQPALQIDGRETYQNDEHDERTEYELILAKRSIQKGIPILGLCNGMQLLNVLFGGSLIQHIPHYIDSKIAHEQPPPKDIASHSIQIQHNTKLFKLNRQQEHMMVNSTHHQAIDKLGHGLVVSAVAPDGIIEAIESMEHDFIYGVQWHPEYLNSDLDYALFRELVEVAAHKKEIKNTQKI